MAGKQERGQQRMRPRLSSPLADRQRRYQNKIRFQYNISIKNSREICIEEMHFEPRFGGNKVFDIMKFQATGPVYSYSSFDSLDLGK